MELEDEINEKLRLPKPSTIIEFEAIEKTSGSDDTSSTGSSFKSGKSYNIKSRNPNLYLQSGTSYEKPYHYEGPDEHDITASIIEAHGGKTSTNHDEVEIWKTRVEKNRLEQLAEKQKSLNEAEEKRLKEEREEKIVEENPKQLLKKTEKNKIFDEHGRATKFKRNVLMRTIEQHSDIGEISATLESPTSSGKNDINNHDNTPMLKQSLEDPDFYYLRDTSLSNFDKLDDFRFEHRGVKKTVTPRHYALHEIPDKCFKFQRN